MQLFCDPSFLNVTFCLQKKKKNSLYLNLKKSRMVLILDKTHRRDSFENFCPIKVSETF